MALCTVSQGHGGRRARGVGVRTRGEATVRLPLSPRTLCTPGSGSAPGSGAQTATHVHQTALRDHHATPTSTTTGEDVAALPDEPMLNVERPDQSGTWICCVPCFWLRRSKAVHKALLTFAMLLVTSLLVTSPVLFLITTLPEGEQPLDCAPLVRIDTNIFLKLCNFH